MNNSIALRISDFLKEFPPFDLLSQDERLLISQQIKVLYYEKGKVIFNSGDEVHNQFYIINKGAVSLKREVNKEIITVDECDEGDLFGLRPLFAKENYKLTATTAEESILYAIPINIFRPLADKNRKVGAFLIESFASNTENPYSKEHEEKFYSENDTLITPADGLFEFQPAKYTKKVFTIAPDTKISEVAELMNIKEMSSAVVTVNKVPLGIVTNEDFRSKVATGKVSVNEPISAIMSSPMICYPKGITIAQAQVTMMKHKINHIGITKDGTPNSKIVGIVSEHDIVVMQGNNPSVLMKAIKRAESTKRLQSIHNKIAKLLKGYIQQNIPMQHTSKIIFELNDATIKRTIERCLLKMDGPPPVNFAWMSLGSQGRKEQLLRTDQDNAIIFENVDPEKLEETRTYFLQLAKKVNKRLKIIGFEYCPADMMAKNPKWCLSVQEWESQFKDWITKPGDDQLLLCSIFFDYDISYGDVRLTNNLSRHIFELTSNNQFFLATLGASALRNPSPLGFFRQFLLEQDGEYKDFFDLKKRALLPAIDSARLLILKHQVKNINNTAERYEKLAELEPENKEIYLACSYAAKALLKFRTKHGLMHHDSGRYIELSALTKEEKIKLKRCFKAVAEVQQLIKLRFNISHFI